MNPLAKKREYAQARAYIQKHPDRTHEELIKDLGISSLTKGYFYNMRNALRKKGVVSVGASSKTEVGKRVGAKPKSAHTEAQLVGVQIEILESVDAAGMSQEIKDHWKLTFLPLLQRILPDGKGVTLVFLADPPIVEVRRAVPGR